MNVTRCLALIICWIGGMTLLQAESKYDTLSYDFSEALPPVMDNSNFIQTPKGLTPFSPESPAIFSTGALQVPVSTAGPFVTMSSYVIFEQRDPLKIVLKYSTSTNGNSWTAFEAFPEFDHLEVGQDTFVSDLVYLSRDVQFIRFEVLYDPTGTAGKSIFFLKNLRLDFFQPGSISPTGVTLQDTNFIAEQERDSACSCMIPNHVTRTSWGNPDGQAYSGSQPAYAPVTHSIIHHSAGSNTSNDWGAVVLSIWNFHTAGVGSGGRGWDDIGYNWLIDPNGIIYEGRGGGNNVVGAHFCGSNTGTMGVCLLGSYENTPPTEAALTSLKDLLAWKFCDSQNDPQATINLPSLGQSIPTISGHKDGCSTLCPGALLHGELPQIRQAVADDTACESISPPTSIDDDLISSDFKLYPNPSNGNFTIAYRQAIPSMNRLVIRDMQGKIVWTRNWQAGAGTREENITLSSIPSGIYVAQFIIDQIAHNQKIIIQN